MFLRRPAQIALFSRLVVGVSLASFAAAIIGVPVAVRIPVAKDRSQPYPCQDHACGCASALQCWQSCCCFTNTQKLAWAEKNGVMPPEYVVAAAKREKPAAAVKSCCSAKPKSACCQAASSCCEHSAADDHHADDEAEATATWIVTFVPAVQARRCQGQAELWLTLGAVAPMPSPIALHIEMVSCDYVFSFATLTQGVSLAPPTPPPWA